MFIRVQERKTKNKGITYNFYACEKVDGKRKDTFILKINQADFEDGIAWEDVIAEKKFSNDLFKLVHDKACNIWNEYYQTIDRLNYTCDDLNDCKLYYGNRLITIFNKDNCSRDEVCSNIAKHHMNTLDELGITYREVVIFVRNVIYGDDKEKIRQLEMEVSYWKSMASVNKATNYTFSVSPNLSKDEYRTLLKCCHPDNGGSNEAMQILNKLANK